MKTFLTLMVMAMLAGQLQSQETSTHATAASATNELITRITALEQSVALAKTAEDKLQTTDMKDRYKNSLTLLRSGLENGGRIEDILPSSMQLLALADVTTVMTDINNPTSNTLGTSFTDMAVSSASKNLLPKYTSNPMENQKVEKRFKSILGAIINNPVVQSLANSNPITATINTVIQQAGLFQNKTSTVKLNEQQIRDRRDVTLVVDFQKPDGPDFDEPQIRAFYDDIKERVDFYVELNKLNTTHADTIKQLQMDARVIKKNIKSSKADICKLLEIPSVNYSSAFDAKYDTQDINVTKNFLKDAKFTKAINLSIHVQEQLDDVLDFNNNVIAAISNYINDYIAILEKYKNNPNIKFHKSGVENTIKILKAHKKTFAPAAVR